MKQDQVAKRYAIAVFEIAKDKNIVDQMTEELKVRVKSLKQLIYLKRSSSTQKYHKRKRLLLKRALKENQ
ncbi:F0F1 ATP synthase subunit delta [Anaerobacillus sp. HL2]|nr:F0F1 ATP synthase subunit delta [Anaerobacillus sp. HL2]